MDQHYHHRIEDDSGKFYIKIFGKGEGKSAHKRGAEENVEDLEKTHVCHLESSVKGQRLADLTAKYAPTELFHVEQALIHHSELIGCDHYQHQNEKDDSNVLHQSGVQTA